MDSVAILTAPAEKAPAKTAASGSSGKNDGNRSGDFLKSLHTAVRALRTSGTAQNAASRQAAGNAPDDTSSNARGEEPSAALKPVATATDASAEAAGQAEIPENGARADETPEETATDAQTALAELLASLMQPLDPQGQEALTRIAGLAAGGVIDGQELAGLDETQLGELADWVLAGAGGLFPPFDGAADAAGVAGEESGLAQLLGGADFGLGQAAQSLAQWQKLQERVAQADALTSTEGFRDYLAQLSGAEEIDPLALDQAAGNLLQSLSAAVEQAGGDPDAMTLRDLLGAVSAEQLADLADAALAKAGATQKLPQLPEAVLRSLCIEIVNVNNDTTVAADQRTALLDGLENNGILRAEILRQTAEEIAQGANPAPAADKTALAGAAQELLQDDSAELPAQNAESGTVIVKDQSAVAETAEKAGSAEEISAVPAESAEETSAPSLNQPATAKNSEAAAGKIPAAETAGTEANPDHGASNGEDAGSAFEDQAEAGILSADAEEEPQSPEEPFPAVPGTGAENPVESGARMAAADPLRPSDGTAPATRAESPAAPHSAEMAENIERLEKLLRVSSGNNLKNITLQLNPQELGKITIDVEYRDGAVHATIKAESEAARDLLLGGTDQLRRNLETSGIKVETLDVSVDSENNDETSGRNQAEWEAARDEQEKRQRQRGRASGNGAPEEPDGPEPETAASYNGEGPLNIIA